MYLYRCFHLLLYWDCICLRILMKLTVKTREFIITIIYVKIMTLQVLENEPVGNTTLKIWIQILNMNVCYWRLKWCVVSCPCMFLHEGFWQTWHHRHQRHFSMSLVKGRPAAWVMLVCSLVYWKEHYLHCRCWTLFITIILHLKRQNSTVHDVVVCEPVGGEILRVCGTNSGLPTVYVLAIGHSLLSPHPKLPKWKFLECDA